MVDEMSQGLAPTLVADLFARIASFPKRGVSVLLVEQFVSRALHVADRAYVLEKGEITFAGPASKLARDRAFVHGSYLGGKRGPRRRRRSVEQGRTESVSLHLPPALLRRLEERAEAEGVPLADLVTAAVERTADSRNGTRSTTRKRRR
jgi:ABC-type multidrug transport system ATPase subunit